MADHTTIPTGLAAAIRALIQVTLDTVPWCDGTPAWDAAVSYRDMPAVLNQLDEPHRSLLRSILDEDDR